MDSSVTPTSPSEMAILVAGLLIMLFGGFTKCTASGAVPVC